MLNKTKNYIKDTIGLESEIISYDSIVLKTLPLYIKQFYNIYRLKLLNKELCLLLAKADVTLKPSQYEKHTLLIEKTFQIPVVLLINQMEAFMRKRLIQKRIAFIVPARQMYIPQMLIDLKEFNYSIKDKQELLPTSAQVLLLYHLQKKDLSLMNFKQIALELAYSEMTISRASKILKDFDLCDIKGKKDKQFVFPYDKKQLWLKALPFMQSPVKDEFFTENKPDNPSFIISGLTALSEYSLIADDNTVNYAIDEIKFKELRKNKTLQELNKYEGQYSIEVWKYSPAMFAKNKIVDFLSLYLIFNKESDERIQIALENKLNKLW